MKFLRNFLFLVLLLVASNLFGPVPSTPRTIEERDYVLEDIHSEVVHQYINLAERKSRRYFLPRRYQTLEEDSAIQLFDLHNGVEFFSQAQLEGMKLQFYNGKILYGGRELTTTNGRWMYVMDEKGNFYAHPESRFKWHHSSFFGRGTKRGDIWQFKFPAAAGMFTVENGVLKSIDAASGHYKPGVFHFAQALSSLEEKGVSLKGVEGVYFDHETQKRLHTVLDRTRPSESTGVIRGCLRSLGLVGS